MVVLNIIWSTNHNQRLSTQTIPELTLPKACTHSPKSFWSGELSAILEPPCATTSPKGPPIFNTKIFPVQVLQLEPLLNDHVL